MGTNNVGFLGCCAKILFTYFFQSLLVTLNHLAPVYITKQEVGTIRGMLAHRNCKNGRQASGATPRSPGWKTKLAEIPYQKMDKIRLRLETEIIFNMREGEAHGSWKLGMAVVRVLGELSVGHQKGGIMGRTASSQ